MSHGILARVHNIRIKSSGVGVIGLILPILPVAFVEPDEKQLKRASARKKLSVFAAGPFSNILTAVLILLLLNFAIGPATQDMTSIQGVSYFVIEDEILPSNIAGMQNNQTIISLDSNSITNLSGFIEHMETKSPGDTLQIETNVTSYSLILAEHPEDNSKPYIGIRPFEILDYKPEIKERYGESLLGAFEWTVGFIWILFLLSLGLGLMNLAPLIITDGGQMLLVVTSAISPTVRTPSP